MKNYQVVLRIASFFFGIYLWVCLFSFSLSDGWGFGEENIHNLGGKLGAVLSYLFFSFLGVGAYFLPLLFFLYWKNILLLRNIVLVVSVSLTVQLITILNFEFSQFKGGLLGHHLNELLLYVFGISGTYIILGGAYSYILFPILEIGFYKIKNSKFENKNKSKNLKKYFFTILLFIQNIAFFVFKKISIKNFKNLRSNTNSISKESLVHAQPNGLEESNSFIEKTSLFTLTHLTNETNVENQKIPTKNKILINHKNPFSKRNEKFELPVLSLLDPKLDINLKLSRSSLEETANLIVKKLETFNIKGEITGFHDGPVVSQFEFKPEDGVKISSLVNLSDDLSMALSSQAVRVIGQIPGKSVVGIEVPKQNREDVFISELLASLEYENSKAEIPLALGKTTNGAPYISDLAKMPHLLVAGTTGSGKSMFEASILCGLLYRFKPQELKMILIDPKRVDLAIWNDIPHLLYPVVVDYKEAGLILKWAVDEMERRYDLIAKLGARNIQTFNEKFRQLSEKQKEELALQEELPKIMIMIDELADLMMVARSEVEVSICRLAQKARAAGIHLIVATQRPSTDVITGLIKANFSCRLSFKVASNIDSKTILDKVGAEKLLGRGDMLFIPPGESHLMRLHGARIIESEVERIVRHVKSQQEPIYEIDLDESDDENFNNPLEKDELFEQAKELVVHRKMASTSFLQRALEIGYPRAARLMDQLEAHGVVGPARGGKAREIFG